MRSKGLLWGVALVALATAPPAGAVNYAPAPGYPIDVGDGADQIAVADVDADGNQDALVVNQSDDDVAVLLGDGTGGVAEVPRVPIPGSGPLAVDDFDGDSKLDFAVSVSDSRVAVMLGDGAGGFLPAPNSPFETTPGAGSWGVATADFDLDGNRDIAVVHPNPRIGHDNSLTGDAVTILLGDGNGDFDSPGSRFPTNHLPRGIATADFNRDGNPDVVTSNLGDRHGGNGFNVMLGDGNGGLGAPMYVLRQSRPSTIATGDFDGDGEVDVALPGLGGVDVFLGDGTGAFAEAAGSTFPAGPTFSFPITPQAVGSGDLDADGDVDLATADSVVPSAPPSASVLLGDGAGDFAAPSGSPFPLGGGNPHGIGLGDFDGDTLLDLAVVGYTLTSSSTPGPSKFTLLLNAPPDTAIADGPSGTVQSPDATFSFVSPDTSSTFECRLDGGGWSACTSSKSYSKLTAGSHTFEVRATNDVGKTDPSPAARTWTVSAPSTSIESGPQGATRRTSATFTFGSSPSGVGFQCRLDGGAFELCSSPRSYSGLGGGTHTFEVRAIDDAGNIDPAPAARSWTIDLTTPPIAALTATPDLVLTGDSVTFDASASRDPLDGTIVEHRWDLDGDGSFELDTDGTPTATHAYSEPGFVDARVRVTNEVGTSATASVRVEVRRAPPAGELGVSINDGARFTNRLRVTVSAVWPRFATALRISNDGGFREAQSFPVAPEVAWTLDPNDSERVPRIIYVRFAGGGSGPETSHDARVRARTRPAVPAARVLDPSPPSFKLKLRAADGVSGVLYAQTAVATRDPDAAMRYRSTLRVRGSKRPRWVRVRDRAGNWSPWRRVSARPRR